MSTRVFRGPTHNSTSQYLKQTIDYQTITRTVTGTNTGTNTGIDTDRCIKSFNCNTLNIARYNRLKQIQTINNNMDSNIDNIHFTGQIPEANYLVCTISGEQLNQLIYNNRDSMQLNLATVTGINNNNENLFVIDRLISHPCLNIFRLETPAITYSLSPAIKANPYTYPYLLSLSRRNKPKLCTLR